MRKCSNLPKNPSMEGIMCKLDEIMKKRASSPEFVGELRFWEFAKLVI